MYSTPTPEQRYRQDLAAGRIITDPAQEKAVIALDGIYRQMCAYWGRKPGLLTRLLGKSPPPGIRGLYLWGGVGRGKTYLMDLFFTCLPGDRKMRMHFHRFMQHVHRGLYVHRGRKNPLDSVAADISARADILCFDEFFVSDIGDAMILANLLEALFGNGLVLIATSNILPARLYERGLQRAKFLPAIALLERHTDILNVDGGIDYRLRSLEKAGIYHTPLGEAAERELDACFRDLTAGQETAGGIDLEILGRDIRTLHWAEGIAWFDFSALCDGPRSAADYIEIAQLFHTVLLSNVPAMDAHLDDQARRFISMVDEFYDQSVKLILSAATDLDGLYSGSELAFPFERTRSRLLEMQSTEYLAREHQPAGRRQHRAAPGRG